MTPLDNQQEQLLFDYAMGLASEGDAADAEKLLETRPEAKHLYQALRSALSPLDSFEVEPCPDYLAEQTISGLKDEARGDAGQQLSLIHI